MVERAELAAAPRRTWSELQTTADRLRRVIQSYTWTDQRGNERHEEGLGSGFCYCVKVHCACLELCPEPCPLGLSLGTKPERERRSSEGTRSEKMLTYVDVSLFDSPAQTLVNTVNTVGVMGKGIAAVFKQLYPEMYQRYRRLCQEGKLDMGMLYVYRTNRIIVNFPTKKHWRERSRVEYIEAGLEKFVIHYGDYGISSVSFPQLGCGHGELDWEAQVQPVMERHLRDLPIPVYIHLYPKPPDFIPERLDADYARQVRMERQRISAERLWQDLRRLVGKAYQLTLFGPTVEVDEEHILFKPLNGRSEPVIVYREDVEDLWNTLRLRGTVRETDVPQPIGENGAMSWLFELLKRVDYIQPVTLHTRDRGVSQGLRYVPLPDTTLLRETEIVV